MEEGEEATLFSAEETFVWSAKGVDEVEEGFTVTAAAEEEEEEEADKDEDEDAADCNGRVTLMSSTTAILWSREPRTKRRESGLQLMSKMSSQGHLTTLYCRSDSWVSMFQKYRPFPPPRFEGGIDQTITVPLSPAVARERPSGLKRRQFTHLSCLVRVRTWTNGEVRRDEDDA